MRLHIAVQIHAERIDSWPPLAWLARGRRGSKAIELFHGSRVEVTPTWFCEAVWDGPYEAGNFDRTDLVFGSGARARNGKITFVSAGSTVDRLQVMETDRGDCVWISNSLTCLLAAQGAQPDPAYRHYFRDFSSIRFGLSRYAPLVPTNAGAARLIYFHNLRWDGTSLSQVEKPCSGRRFSSFRRYRTFLESALRRIAENMAAPGRRHPYGFLGTISSGYDSPAVAVLARAAGLQRVIAFDRSKDGQPDSGKQIAARLGLSVVEVPHDGWQAPLAEVPFLAADAKGEDVYFSGAERHLDGAVLLTGFHGDKVWGMHAPSAGSDLARGDQSGLSLTEYRLRAAFIHCPVPFMGVRQIRDINQISRSAALSPWDVKGNYSRPICRRIVEEAGVPRTWFGTEKKAASVLFFKNSSFLAPQTLPEYLQWLQANAGAWREAGLEPPVAMPGRHETALQGAVARLTKIIAQRTGTGEGVLGRVVRRVGVWADREPLFRWVFPWAVERAGMAYTPISIRD
jgi:hypothetical protein